MSKTIGFTRAGFRAWLEGKGAIETVGYTTSANRCPIACYMTEELGVRRAVVTPSIICYPGLNRTTARVPPDWVSDFIHEVERRIGGCIDDPRAEVSAAQALEVLEYIAGDYRFAGAEVGQ